MRRPSTSEKAAQLAALLAAIVAAAAGPTCTGLTAQWCPIHGTCACPGQIPIAGTTQVSGPMIDPMCPLHAATSSHAE